MQNKCGSCNQQGFMPVNGNWDFNLNGDRGCAANYGCDSRNVRRNRGNNGCKQCERKDEDRTVECCEQNTYVRDTDGCECSGNSRNRSNDCDKCEPAYTRNRNNGCNDCDKCESTYTRNRNNGCTDCDKCGKDNGNNCSRSGKNRGVGMVKGYMQEIDEIFRSESALRAGTLFPELHKPLNGYCPYDGNCGTCAQAAAFAAWELRLYLNTHPYDEEALALFRKLCKEADEPNYATAFLKDDGCTSNWNWVKNPWPWEFDCKCGD